MSTTTIATSDRIRLVGLSARGHHGVLPFEREEGQLFTVDVTLELGARGTAVAAVTDSLDDAVDYAAVASAVVAVIEGEPLNLLETLADRIAERVLSFPRVLGAQITVHKPQAPLEVAFEDVAVTIYRDNQSAAQAGPVVEAIAEAAAGFAAGPVAAGVAGVGAGVVGVGAGALAAEGLAAEGLAAEAPAPAVEDFAAPVAQIPVAADVVPEFASHGVETLAPAPDESAFAAGALPVTEAPLPTPQAAPQDPWGPDQWMNAVAAPDHAAAEPVVPEPQAAVADQFFAAASDAAAGAPAPESVAEVAEVVGGAEVVEGAGFAAAENFAAAEDVAAEGSTNFAEAAAFTQDVVDSQAPADLESVESVESPELDSVPIGLPVQLPGEGRHRTESDVEPEVEPATDFAPDFEAGTEAGAEAGAEAGVANVVEAEAQADVAADFAVDAAVGLEPVVATEPTVDAVESVEAADAAEAFAPVEAADAVNAVDAAEALKPAAPLNLVDAADVMAPVVPAPAPEAPAPPPAPEVPAPAPEAADLSTPGAEETLVPSGTTDVVEDDASPSPLAVPAPIDPLGQRPGRPVGVVFALGANAGHLLVNLRQAVNSLRAWEGIEIHQVGPLARSVAVVPEGGAAQPDYLNTVVTGLTTLSPRELLGVCQALETEAGRVRTQHWGPRTLDVDLVVVEGVSSQDPDLTLPHPRAHERAFVLTPWSQAEPFAELDGQAVGELAEHAPDRAGLRWLAFDWVDTDNIPRKPTGPYVAPPVADQDPEPMEQVYNATRNERVVMDAELAAEYLSDIGELSPQDAAADQALGTPEMQDAPVAPAVPAVPDAPAVPEVPGAENPFVAASFGTDYALPAEGANQFEPAAPVAPVVPGAPGVPGQIADPALAQAPAPGDPAPAPAGQVPGNFAQHIAQPGEEDSWQAPLQWNEVIGGSDGVGPRKGS